MTVTTTTSVTELVASEAIDELIIHYQFDEQVFTPFARFKSMSDKPSNVASFPRAVKDAHTDVANQTTSLVPNEFETTEVSATMARVGIARELSSEALDDTILGRAKLVDELVADAARLLGEACDEDFAGNFGSATNSVSDSGNDLEIVDLVVAMGLERTARVRGAMVYGLHHQQLSDLQDAQVADTGNPWAAFYSPNVDGSNFGGFFMGAPVFSSNLNPTANTGANRVGCLWAQGQASPKYCAFGYASKYSNRSRSDVDILADTDLWAFYARYGFAVVAANFACKIVTDA